MPKTVLMTPSIVARNIDWACERFLRDISREGTDEFPYIFDDAKAESFINGQVYISILKGVLVNTPIIFTPIQRFIFGNIYGWIHKDTGYRKIYKAYWQVGRKMQNLNH